MAIMVKAVVRGYYGRLREEGDVFAIANEKAFSDVWMVKMKPKTRASSAKKTAKPEEGEDE